MDINQELDKLIFQYGIDRPFPAYRRILKDRGYIIYPTDDVINEGKFVLEKENNHLDLAHAVYQERKKFRQADSMEEKAQSIQRLIFMYVYLKDFVHAFGMIGTYVQNGYEGKEKYQDFAEELRRLFGQITKACKQRTGIINYWLDALDYGMEKHMPYLNKISSKCVYFAHAYTFTNWTSYTLKNIITAKRTIDDKAYRIETVDTDSKLFCILQEQDMGFCYYGHHTYTFAKSCCTKREFSRYQPSTLLLWEALCDILAGEHKTMCLVHILTETHMPWLFSELDGEYYHKETIYDTGLIQSDTHAKEKRLQARVYVDGQLEFYDALFGDSFTRIYMSDHGDGWDGYDYFSDSHHTMLMVRDEKQMPVSIRSYFSYIDYWKLIQSVLAKRQITDAIGKAYAVIQGVNYCAGFEIQNRLNKERFSPDFLMGRRGIVSENDNYVLRADGYERYRRKGDEINYIDFSEYQDRVAELRSLAGNAFPDVYGEDVFIHSRAVQQVIERYQKRVGKEEPGVTMMKEYVDSIPDGKRIAIRGNGKHTTALLGVLADRYQRIRYIADRNTQVTPVLGIPVISPEELIAKKPDVVLISSLKYHKEFAQEIAASGIGCEVYDIYEELEKKGIYLDRGFYEMRYIDADFEGITV